ILANQHAPDLEVALAPAGASRRARPSSSLRVARSSVPKASSWILLAIIRRNSSTVRLLGRGRPNSACQRRRSAAPDNDRTRSISASTAAASTNRCSMSGRPRLDHAIDPLAVRLLGLQRQPELLAHHPRQKAAHRMGLAGGRVYDGRNGRALRPVQERHHRSLLRLGAGVVMDGLCPLHLRSGLRCRARLCTPLSFTLGHVVAPLWVAAHHRAATTATPRRAYGAG